MMQFDKRGSAENLTDAAIISAAQRVEHYEISAYGTLRTYAEQLGNSRVVRLLEQTKKEEVEADRKLSEISQQLISSEHGGVEMEEEQSEGMAMRAGNGCSFRSSRTPSSSRGGRH